MQCDHGDTTAKICTLGNSGVSSQPAASRGELAGLSTTAAGNSATEDGPESLLNRHCQRETPRGVLTHSHRPKMMAELEPSACFCPSHRMVRHLPRCPMLSLKVLLSKHQQNVQK
ncbi:hypothetical protein IscW_ISCW003518 [Ixodes scapularis]|uniref:Uncharacterized protein n=1 Tax=Ixodes scapularis TaxID=6945 RepID=B7PJ60_IXOSC|nr:hypothetical protein IscW_ISCW003518 [Ixodes scapularis]|eukprot:XP_002407205.1 hypothetical protein IscW_ISCW003518 [Ixodes scapularis]